MDILLSRRLKMINNVTRYIEDIYTRGNTKYILKNYVNSDYWTAKIQAFFNSYYVENLTDYNYSTCFTMYINISDTTAEVGTEEFRNFIKDFGPLYRIQIQISAIAPFAVIKYIKYEYDNGNFSYEDSFLPYMHSHYVLDDKIKEFLEKNNVHLLGSDSLSLEIDNISLELKEEGVTVYNCLFEDEYQR